MAAAEKMEQYKFRERPSRMKRVKALAELRGDNVSELIRDAFKDYLRTHGHELPAEEQAIETDEEN